MQSMFDVERLLGQMLSGGVRRATGGMSDILGSGMGAVNGGIGSGLGKGALGLSALGVAWAAFEHFQEKNQASAAQPPPAMPPPLPPQAMPAQAMPAQAAPALPMPIASAAAIASDTREADAMHLIRAMISAANADGHIDAQERAHILERALSAGLSPSTQQFLLGELNAPTALEQIVRDTRPGLRREVYAASSLAITADTSAEQEYLQALARGLALSDAELGDIRTALAR
jgi:uncharacterized membrane protein YebE (DUF533 family)